MTPFEKQEMLQKALRGELTPEDTRRYIEATRASFLANAAKSAKTPGGTVKKAKAQETDEPLDFF